MTRRERTVAKTRVVVWMVWVWGMCKEREESRSLPVGWMVVKVADKQEF